MRCLALLLLAASPAVAQPMSPPDTWQPRMTAELSALDKVRAQPASLSVRVGQSVTFGTLTIAVRGCFARPPDLPQDSTAFIEITDSRPTGTGFRGWMLANAPSLSQFEHPIYDLRVVSCR
ncbi:MAG: DUF2155 domain-containing protein [Gemmatimonadaceae bacterium]|nr:DUF2155 domain-containing protein [Acetobacteraceae bacterium]